MPIHKQYLKPGEPELGGYLISKIEVPQGSRVLTAHEQNGELAVWYEVPDPDSLDEPASVWLTFFLVPTGGAVPAQATAYLATVFIEWTVWHVYL